MIRRRPRPTVSRTTAALFGLVLAVVAALLVAPVFSPPVSVHAGERAPRSLEAVHGAQYESKVLTDIARDNAAAAVAPIPLPTDPGVRQQQRDRLNRLMDQVKTVRQRTDLTTAQQLAEISNLALAEKLSATGRINLLVMDRSAYDTLQQNVGRALLEILSGPVPQNEVTQRIDDYLAQPGTAPAGAIELTVFRELLKTFVTPNVQVDEAATSKRREEARQGVGAVVVTYTKGQVIATEGQVLSTADLEALRASGVVGDRLDAFELAGGSLLAALFGLGLGVYLWQFQPLAAPAGRRAVIAGLAIAGVLVAVRLIIPHVTPDREGHYLALGIPVAVAALTAAAFADLPFAMVVAVCTGFMAVFVGATVPELPGASYVGSLESFDYALAYVAGGMAGALTVNRAERLGRYPLAAVAVAGATWVVMLVNWLLTDPRSNESLAWFSMASAVNGVATAVVALGVFVLFSTLLGVTTRLQLMELADTSSALLRRMQDEAAGTYHHSMMVSALAERAANRIGADALVARVGAYYHDIGKLSQPRFYVENMLDGQLSPHERMEPRASAAVIREHVSNGVDMAKRHRLPAIVRDFIPQHHGTRLVSYFYRRAVQDGQAVDPDDFRYAGPRPQTKETAIVMLADSCEAVVRAAEDRAKERIEELVDGVIAERLAEGQFDECDITMRELVEVASSFKATLQAVYHRRIEYPEPVPEELAAIAGAGFVSVE